MTPGFASEGAYTSAVLDATQISRFGKMQLHGTLPAGTRLTVSTRSSNVSENSDVPSDRASLFARVTRPVQDQRVNKTRWVVLRWPTPSMAQLANRSTEAFEDFYFDVCTLDYRRMGEAMRPLGA